LRRCPIFYFLRDLVRFKYFYQRKEKYRLIKENILDSGRRWKALPFGREIIVDE